ncbi:hypothetical protein ElyMa_004193500 [Elysia marginata]|uniref:Uncharacterized protein n=1 Tax=Elysia marginata TaxID=1093978 RepID=A0AAV4GMR2_9GAST|nr:hypothetical protein ElyMa_004193500 [Elysia marginata]
MALPALTHLLLLSALALPVASLITTTLKSKFQFGSPGFLTLSKDTTVGGAKYNLFISSPNSSGSKVGVVKDVGAQLRDNADSITPNEINNAVVWPNVVNAIPRKC